MSASSNLLYSKVESFYEDDMTLRSWDNNLLYSFFYSIFPALLIYLIESENVTFRRLAKTCDLQSNVLPILAYLLALIPITAILSYFAYFLLSDRFKIGLLIKLFAIVLILVLGFLMLLDTSQFRWKTKSIYNKHKQHLVTGLPSIASYHKEYDSNHYPKDFSQLLFSNWAVLNYEVTQKVIFLLAFTGEPIRTFICAVVAYIFLVITAGVNGRKATKESTQRNLQVLAGLGLFIWGFKPVILLFFSF
jgi:hypothetical protein